MKVNSIESDLFLAIVVAESRIGAIILEIVLVVQDKLINISMIVDLFNRSNLFFANNATFRFLLFQVFPHLQMLKILEWWKYFFKHFSD